MNLLVSKCRVIMSGMAELLNAMRKAIEASGQSRYRISKETGIAESVLSRFMSGGNSAHRRNGGTAGRLP